VSLVPRNAIVGLVGESGSGKTTTGMMALRLTEPTAGQILIDGTDITALTPGPETHRRKMQVVFQDSYSALDPMFTLARSWPNRCTSTASARAKEQTAQALDWLERVGCTAATASRYPHECPAASGSAWPSPAP
jgi:ABC-type oligopeptide transport system ATPase subunit